jgi:hypothetical protein
MLAKEKAKELVNEYTNRASTCGEQTEWDYDKECALICVDEILKNVILGELFYEYYEEVKEEIYKL